MGINFILPKCEVLILKGLKIVRLHYNIFIYYNILYIIIFLYIIMAFTYPISVYFNVPSHIGSSINSISSSLLQLGNSYSSMSRIYEFCNNNYNN